MYTEAAVSVLYVVATPIGNLADITLRAIETFKSVDVVAAEDTRVTLRLLNHLGIRKPLISCRAQNEEEAAGKIARLLDEGKDIAYASDAGTPALSDPGALLVARARRAGHSVTPVPGPSAFSALVSVAGEGARGARAVVFAGFLSPRAGRRRAALKALLSSECAVVLYEAPHRIVKLLEDIAALDAARPLVIGRELTKVHEEIFEGTAVECLAEFSSRDKVLGEFALFISANKTVKISGIPSDKEM